MRFMQSRSGPVGRRSRVSRSVVFGAALAAAIVTSIPASAAAPSARSSKAQPPALPAKWVGTWRLVSEHLVDQNGAVVGVAFNDAVGKVTYTPRGDLWAIVGPRVPSNVAPQFWYTATAELHRKAGVIVHHVQASSVPSVVGTDQVRGFQFSAHDKRLTLTAEFSSGLSDVLKWRKVGARWAGPL